MRATIAFCLVYCVVALPNRTHERFPFFSWDLFSRVPEARISDYSIRLEEAQGVHVPLPVYFESSNILTKGLRAQGFQAITNWGVAFSKGKKLQAALLRQQFEQTYLSTFGHVRYQLVRRTFDVRERLDCNDCFVREKVLATYTVG